MLGDGINYRHLQPPTWGVAIDSGSGSDVTISSADFVLLNPDLHSVVNQLDLSRTVFRRIKFNFGWALVYNCTAVPVAARCPYPIVSHSSHWGDKSDDASPHDQNPQSSPCNFKAAFLSQIGLY
ncbi:hypothetical protein EDB80DRAFT_825312 [Ilyonectria destructans]|nr:hypothetical protein EDB80DRAFT_825312 [Ilyonectria destructans]